MRRAHRNVAWWLFIVLTLLPPGAAAEELQSDESWRERVSGILYVFVDRIQLLQDAVDSLGTRVDTEKRNVESEFERIDRRLSDIAVAALVSDGGQVNSHFDTNLSLERGREPQVIWLKIGQPTDIELPSEIERGYRSKSSHLSIDRYERHLIVVATETLEAEGEIILCALKDGRVIALALKAATGDQTADVQVKISE